MNRIERLQNLQASLLAAMRGWQQEVWTALPGIVEAFDAGKETLTIRPAVLIPLTGTDGSVELVQMPLLLDVPVIFPSGGGFTLTFPIVKGDEVLVIFASRCIDAWWASGAAHLSNTKAFIGEMRLHDLSDGFAIPGPTSQPRKISGISSDSVQLRSNDGAAFIEIKNGHLVTIEAPGGLVITAPTIEMNAANSVALNTPAVTGGGTAVFAGEGTFDGHTVGGHTHGGVAPGGSSTSGPTG